MISIEILNTYLESHFKSIFIILIGVIIIGYTGGGLWINKLLSDIEHIETIENQNRASVEERYQLGYAQLFVKIDKLNQYLLEVQELLYDYFSKQEWDDRRILNWAYSIGPQTGEVITRIFSGVKIKEQG